MPNLGGQPQAHQQQPPQITDEMPNVPMTADAANPRAGGAAIPLTSDENAARTDRILRERAQAQQANQDVRDLREELSQNKRTVAESRPPAKPKLVAPAGEVEVYNPESDAAAVAAMTGEDLAVKPAEAVALPTSQQPARVPNDGFNSLLANNQIPEDQRDVGDRNPNSADGLMMTPTNSQLFSNANSQPGPNIIRQSSVDPMLSLDQTFSNKVAANPTDLSSQLEYQLLQFLRDQPVPRQTDIAALNTEDQALLSAMCDALTNFRSVVRKQPNAMSSEKARPFVEMAERISSQADLSLGSPTLCEEVAAFGSYTPLDSRRFVAGSTVPAVFYCEVDGFQPVLNAEQQYETKLSLELKLYSASRATLAWRLPTMNVNDVSRRRRRDFFIAKMIELPANLPADTYLLKAVVKDLQGNRMAEKTLQFVLSNPAGR